MIEAVMTRSVASTMVTATIGTARIKVKMAMARLVGTRAITVLRGAARTVMPVRYHYGRQVCRPREPGRFVLAAMRRGSS